MQLATETNGRGLTGMWKRLRGRLRDEWFTRRERRTLEDRLCFDVEQLEQRVLLSGTVVDNSDTNFTMFAGAGEQWDQISGGGFGDGYVKTTGEDVAAEWLFEDVALGTYAVFATSPASVSNTAGARYTLYVDNDGDGTGSRGTSNLDKEDFAGSSRIDQTTNDRFIGDIGIYRIEDQGVTWTFIGTVEVVGNGSQQADLLVNLVPQGPGKLVADAIQIIDWTPSQGSPSPLLPAASDEISLTLENVGGDPVDGDPRKVLTHRKAYMQVNSDFDENNRPIVHVGRSAEEVLGPLHPDHWPSAAVPVDTYGGINPLPRTPENSPSIYEELVRGTISAPYHGPYASWKLEYSSLRVNVWRTLPGGSSYELIESGKSYAYSASFSSEIFVEGWGPGSGKLIFTAISGQEDLGGYAESEVIELTLIDVDVDIDSNNDGIIDHSEDEDSIEHYKIDESITGPGDPPWEDVWSDAAPHGKIIYWNDGPDQPDRTPVTIRVTGAPANSRIMIEHLKDTFDVYLSPDGNDRWAPGNPGERDLASTPTTVWIEGLLNDNTVSDLSDFLTVEIVPMETEHYGGGVHPSLPHLPADRVDVTVQKARVDMDIDSDNNSGLDIPHSGPEEDEIEGDPLETGKLIVVNNQDLDGDGVLDFMDEDTTSVANTFTPIVLDMGNDLPDPNDDAWDDMKIRFHYSASHPFQIPLGATSPRGNVMRIWRTPSNELRSFDEPTSGFVYDDRLYDLDEFINRQNPESITLWIEGINVVPTLDPFHHTNRLIEVEYFPNYAQDPSVSFGDSVYVSLWKHSDGEGTVTGHVFQDRNRNHEWDNEVVKGDEPDVVLVVDISGSSGNTFTGQSVGDLNGDEFSNTILDAEIAGMTALIHQLNSQGFGSTANLSIIAFDSRAYLTDIFPDVPGDQTSVLVSADHDGNGILDAIEALRRLREDDGGTSFSDPLLEVEKFFDRVGTRPGNANVIMLTDGDSPDDLGGLRELADSLRNGPHQANIRAFGVGTEAEMDKLRAIDPRAFRFDSTDDILRTFAGLGTDEPPEDGLAGWTVFVDYNGDGVLSTTPVLEPSATTDSNGFYVIENVNGADDEPYHVVRAKRTDDALGWLQTAPFAGTTGEPDHHQVYLDGDQTVSDIDFGVIFDGAAAPSGSLDVTPGPGSRFEGDPLTVTVNLNPGVYDENGAIPPRYSFDLTGDGDFDDPEDIFRSLESVATLVIDDQSDSYLVKAEVHDAAGKTTPLSKVISIANVAPEPRIEGLMETLELTDVWSPANSAPLTLGLSGVIGDASGADWTARFDYTWSVEYRESAQATPEAFGDPESGTTPETDPGRTSFSLVTDGPGLYDITFTATDKDGGTSSLAQTLNLTSAAPYIRSITYPTADVTGTEVTLSVDAVDSGDPDQLRYYWWATGDNATLVRGPQELNGTNAAQTMPIRFVGAGTFEMNVRVMNDSGLFDQRTFTINVVQTETAISIDPVQVFVLEGENTHTLTATTVDQFGNAMTSAGSHTWSIENTSPLGTLTPDSVDDSEAEYKSNNNDEYGVDTIKVTNGTLEGAAEVSVPDPATIPIVGSTGTYAEVDLIEGEVFTSDAEADFVAAFFDARIEVFGATLNLSEYSAQIDWGDNTPVETANVRSNLLADGRTLLEVYVTDGHRYAEPSSQGYTFTATLTHTPTSRSLGVDGTAIVDVQPLRGTGRRLYFDPNATGTFSNVVARFSTPEPGAVWQDFVATVEWANQSVGGTVSIVPVASAPGFFDVTVTDHPYATDLFGQFTVTLTSHGVDAGQITGSVIDINELDIPVRDGVTAPTLSGSAISSSQTMLTWSEHDPVDDVAGYLLYVQEQGSDVRRRIPGNFADIIAGNFRYDQGLKADTPYLYTLQVVFDDGTVSEESTPISVRTAAEVKLPTAVGAEGLHSVAQDPKTLILNEGVQLSWLPAEVGGYRVYRKVDPGGGAPAYWLDLIVDRVDDPNGDPGDTIPEDETARQITIVSGEEPDWASTVPARWESDEVVIDYLLDPTDVFEDGTLGFYERLHWNSEIGASTTTEYAIVAFDLQTIFVEEGQPLPPASDAIVLSDAAVFEVDRDLIPPSDPINVQAMSFPQAIQLTWDDRPEVDDLAMDFAGWNVYRWDTANPLSDPGDAPEDQEHWQLLTPIPIETELGYNDVTAAEGNLWWYKVVTTDLLGNESGSVILSQRRSTNGAPPAPEGLFGQPNGSTGTSLTWAQVVPVQHLGYENDALDGYDVERNVSGDTWLRWDATLGSPAWMSNVGANDATPIDPSITSVESFLDSDINLITGTEYTYRVRSVDKDGDYSAWVEVTAEKGDGTLPMDLTSVVPAQTATSITLTITGTAKAASHSDTDRFRVYRSRRSAGPFEKVAEIPVDSSLVADFDDLGLPSNSTYHYRVYAVDVDGDISNYVAITSSTDDVAAAPPELSLSTLGGGDVVTIDRDTRVYGLVDDPNNNLWSWQLELVPQSVAGDRPVATIVLASGTVDPDGDELPNPGIEPWEIEIGQKDGDPQFLASIRPTMLPNGLYQLRLVAIEEENGEAKDEKIVLNGDVVDIRTDVKLGPLSLPFTDIDLTLPGGERVFAQRVYDSTHAHEDLDGLGFGWRLELSNTDLRSNAQINSRDTSLPAFREGDLVQLDIPGRGQYTFVFYPVALNYDPLAPGTLAYTVGTYAPRFMSIDGSGAVLTLDQDYFTDEGGNTPTLQLTRANDEFIVSVFDLANSSQIVFNPAHHLLGGEYHLTTTDGTKYVIDADSGDVKTETDRNGNEIHHSSDSVGNRHGEIYVGREGGRIVWISTEPSGQSDQTVHYCYNTDGQLVSVTDQAGTTTTYEYDDPTHDHFLTGIASGGNTLINVSYTPSGQVATLTDSSDQGASLGTGAFNGHVAISSATDAQDNTVERVFDKYGNVTREIAPVKDSSGNITDYLVTVREYDVIENHNANLFLYDVSPVGHVTEIVEYRPMKINVSNASNRFSQAPTSNELARKVTFYEMNDGAVDDAQATEFASNKDNWQVHTETVYGPNGEALTTTYSSYDGPGRPETIEDSYGNITTNEYDANGNLEKTIAPDGSITEFTYTSGEIYEFRYFDGEEPYEIDFAGIPNGLLLETIRHRDDNDPNPVVVSVNDYYIGTEAARDQGRLRLTIDSSGAAQFYTYTNSGQVFEVYSGKIASTEDAIARQPNPFEGNLISRSTYDALGRVITTEDGQGDADTPGNQTHTYYDALGRVVVTEDAFGGQTAYGYDVKGNQVLVVYPDGTETRTVYDSLGRVDYSSGRFKTDTTTYSISTDANGITTVSWGTIDNTKSYPVSHSVFDSLGRAAETYQYADESISVTVESGAITGSSFDSGVVPDANMRSGSITIFDDFGRVGQTIQFGYQLDGSGVAQQFGKVRSGTVYYDNGQVKYSGLLKEAGPGVPPGEVVAEDSWPTSDTNFQSLSTTRNGSVYEIDVTETIAEHETFSVTIVDDDNNLEVIDLTATGTVTEESLATQIVDALKNENGTFTTHITADHLNQYGTIVSIENIEALWNATITVSIASEQLTSSQYVFSETTDPIGRESRSYQDAMGRTFRTVLPDGTITLSTYDGLGRRVSETTQFPVGEGDTLTTTYEYDDAGRLIAVNQPMVDIVDPQTPANTISVHPRYEYGYDVFGNQTSITTNAYLSAIGTTIYYQIKDDVTGVDVWIDGASSRSTSSSPPDYTTLDATTTLFTFDDQQRQRSRTLPLGQKEWSIFDDMPFAQIVGDKTASVGGGQLAYSIDFEGRVTQYLYDNTAAGAGRLVEKSYFEPITDLTIDENTTADDLAGLTSPTESVLYTYTDLGQQATITQDRDGVTATPDDQRLTTNGYDDQTGQLISVVSPEGSIYYRYDNLGRMIRTWTGDANDSDNGGTPTTETKYVYDDLGRLDQVIAISENGVDLWATGDQQVTDYDYDELGRLESTLLPNDIVTRYHYDEMDRPTKVEHFKDVGVGDEDREYNSASDTDDEMIELFEYSYANGQRESETAKRYDGGQLSTIAEYDWTYDALGRLTEEKYDAKGAVHDHTADDYTTRYSFDLTGNRLKTETDDDVDMIFDAVEETNYTYDANDRLLTESHVATTALSTTLTNESTKGTPADYEPDIALNSSETLPDLEPGKFGEALRVDGVLGHIDLDSMSTAGKSLVEDTFTKKTVSFWFKADLHDVYDTPQWANWRSLYDEGSYEYGGLAARLKITTGEIAVTALGDDGSGTLVDAYIYLGKHDMHEWHQLTIVFDANSDANSGDLTVYLDGQKYESDPADDIVDIPDHTGGGAAIGKREGSWAFSSGTGGAMFQGWVDDVRIFEDTVLSEAEALTLSGENFAAMADVQPTNLTAHWTMDASIDHTIDYYYGPDQNSVPISGHGDGTELTYQRESVDGDWSVSGERLEAKQFVYDVRGRMTQILVHRLGSPLPNSVEGYVYDDSGIRVRSGSMVLIGDFDMNTIADAFDTDEFEIAVADNQEYEDVYGVDPDLFGDFDGNGDLTAFDTSAYEAFLSAGSPITWLWIPGAKKSLNDPLNPTGYSQVIEESMMRKGATAFDLNRTFTLGLDVIAQWGVESGEVILDNDISTGYSESAGWANSSATDTYNGSAHKSRFTHTQDATATYTPDSLEPGLYEIWVWISGEAGSLVRDGNAKYTITHDGGEADEVFFDQDDEKGKWVKLTAEHFYFTGDGTETVTVERTAQSTGDETVADAVKFVRVEATRYFVNDAHGSTRGLADKNGLIVRTFDYDAYGNAINFDASAALTSLLYSGEEFNVNTGLSYLRARYYDPSNGRFTRLDPFFGDINSPLSLHKYAYVHGNPVMGVDPTGRSLTLDLLYSIKLRAELFMQEVAIKAAPAFAAGGAVLGRFFNRVGATAQSLAANVLNLFRFSRVLTDQKIGHNVIDFVIKNGNRVATLEVKYSLPSKAGDALNRLTNQIQSMVANVASLQSSVQGQAVVWSLTRPTVADLTRIQNAVGPQVFNQVQFVDGINGLFHWVKLYFGL